MSAYLVLEWIVIAALCGLSLRLLWQRVLKPVLSRPKAACGACGQCGTNAAEKR